jgi:hypothetical protein
LSSFVVTSNLELTISPFAVSNVIVGASATGKLQFIPEPDYSKYSDDNLPNFKYKVYDTDGDYAEGTIKIQVKPVADAPTIFVKNIETTEDAGNTKEGTNIVGLGLKVPFLSKDSDKDYNSETTTGYTAKQNSNQNATPTPT